MLQNELHSLEERNGDLKNQNRKVQGKLVNMEKIVYGQSKSKIAAVKKQRDSTSPKPNYHQMHVLPPTSKLTIKNTNTRKLSESKKMATQHSMFSRKDSAPVLHHSN